MVWLALGVSHLLCPYRFLPLPSFHLHRHGTHLKQTARLQEPDIPSGEREDTFFEPSAIWTRNSQGRGVTADPKGPLWPKAPSWWNTVIAWTIFIHSMLQLTTGNERFYTSQQKQIGWSKWLKCSFEPGCLAKLVKCLCAVWKHFTLEIFAYILSKRPCAPHFHPCSQLRILNPFCVK